MGEWIAHDGGKCPVAGNTIVQTRLQLFPKLIGDPVFADACSGWLHQPGEGLYISHYRIVGPQQEQAHMMAAPANLSGQGMLDNSMAAPTRQHVSDAAWEAAEWTQRVELSNSRAEVERLRVQLAGCGVAAMGNTRDSLERNMLDKDAYGYSASYGDVLRAVTREVELREQNEQLGMAMGLLTTLHPTMQIDVLDPMSMARQIVDYVERLRKGREDETVSTDEIENRNSQKESGRLAIEADLAHQRRDMGAKLSLASAASNLLDPRLGTPQPEGEPVGPRPGRRWVPIL